MNSATSVIGVIALFTSLLVVAPISENNTDQAKQLSEIQSTLIRHENVLAQLSDRINEIEAIPHADLSAVQRDVIALKEKVTKFEGNIQAANERQQQVNQRSSSTSDVVDKQEQQRYLERQRYLENLKRLENKPIK